MQRWRPASHCWRWPWGARRSFASTPRRIAPHTEHVHVPCASAGHVTISLHGVSNHPVSTPLIINFPAYPTQDIAEVDSYLPSFLHQYPTATIHYRWSKGRDLPNQLRHNAGPPIPTPLHWPTPVTDTLVAYDYLCKTRSPAAEIGGSPLQRRDIYVHGSYLGASLAASLALTETHVHEPVAVRGVSAYNGIYNWTTFLPDHPCNLILQSDEMLGLVEHDTGAMEKEFAYLRELMPGLFGMPAHMFDPFASPVLFFHTSGMMVPSSFTERWIPPYLSEGGRDSDPNIYVYFDPEGPVPPGPYPDEEDDEWETKYDKMDGARETSGSKEGAGKAESSSDESSASSPSSTDTAAEVAAQYKAPRKGYLRFPPRHTNIKIPETLLLHSTPSPRHRVSEIVSDQREQLKLWKRLKNAENSFGSHALGLGSLMRRSIEKFEMPDRAKWDPDFDGWTGETERRVRIVDAGGGKSGKRDRMEEIAAQWFEERMF